jgi:hypothetical protein
MRRPLRRREGTSIQVENFESMNNVALTPSLRDLPLSNRLRNCLDSIPNGGYAGINYQGSSILDMPATQFASTFSSDRMRRKVRNFGRKSEIELRDIFREIGIEWDEIPTDPVQTILATSALSEKQTAFRAMIVEAQPLQQRVRELGVEQIRLGYEINLAIAKEAFPNAIVKDAAQTMEGELLPSNCIASPHDLPPIDLAIPKRWVLATIAPRDAGRSAMVICDYLKAAGVEPSEIHLQSAMFRVLLVR